MKPNPQRRLERQEDKLLFQQRWNSDFQKLVRTMTNWQRHQWKKAGFPGLASTPPSVKKIRKFCELKKDTK